MYLDRFLEQLETYKNTDEARGNPELLKMLVLLGEGMADIRDRSNADHENFENHRHRVFGAYTEKAAW